MNICTIWVSKEASSDDSGQRSERPSSGWHKVCSKGATDFEVHFPASADSVTHRSDPIILVLFMHEYESSNPPSELLPIAAPQRSRVASYFSNDASHLPWDPYRNLPFYCVRLQESGALNYKAETPG